MSLSGLVAAGPSAATAKALSLPDGRAYEQVSPVEKAGSSVGGTIGGVHSSKEGDRFFFYTTPTLPGSEGAQDTGYYLSSRNPSSWFTVGLLPRPEYGREGSILGATEDLTESFFSSFDTTSETRSTYSQNDLSGQITKILPGTPFIAATSIGDQSLLFESMSTVLPGGDGENNVFVRDKQTGTVRIVSVFNNGESPASGSFVGPGAWQEGGTSEGGERGNSYLSGVFAPEGEDAYFTAAGSGQIYLRLNAMQPQSAMSGEECVEPMAACTVEVSRSQRSVVDPEGPKPAGFLSATWGDDPAAFFLSSAKLTDDATTGSGDNGSDLYRYDLRSRELSDLTPDAADPNGAEVLGTMGNSTDGSRFYFVANGVLGDGASEGAAPGNCENRLPVGECNLYVWIEGGGIHYIARLNAAGEPLKVPRSDQSDWFSQLRPETDGRTAHVSEDGRTLVFRSRNNLGGSGEENIGQYYRYHEGEPGVQCLTCLPAGMAALVGESFGGPTEFSAESATSSFRNPNFTAQNLSENGNRFFFETGDPLVPQDTNGLGGCPEIVQRSFAVSRCQDVYEWEAKGEGTCQSTAQNGGCIYLISGGLSDGPSFFGDADATGANVFFYTVEQLVPQDKDQLQDIYDARVEGGLPEQQSVPSSPCTTSGSCIGPFPATPNNEKAPGSLTVEATSQKKQRKCRKGTVQTHRHGKVVCKKKNKRHRPSRRIGKIHHSNARKAGAK